MVFIKLIYFQSQYNNEYMSVVLQYNDPLIIIYLLTLNYIFLGIYFRKSNTKKGRLEIGFWWEQVTWGASLRLSFGQTIIGRVNSEKFQNSHFKPKLSFLGEFSDFYEVPIYDFRDLPENGHFDNDYFRENFEKSYIVWINIIFVILHQKRQFRLENESFEISRNSP